MATRPIVPRANGEGSLGVNTAGAEKFWGNVFTQKINDIPVENLGSIPLGFTTPLLQATAPDGWLACQGAEVSRATYPDLWNLVSSTNQFITEQEWQSKNTSGDINIGWFSSGDGTTTFRLPRIVGSGELTEVKRFTTAGAGTFTAPITGIYRITLQGAGGGGSGAGTDGHGQHNSGSSGGQGGHYEFYEKLTAGTSYNFTIGAGGAGGTAGGNGTNAFGGAGSAGGSSSVTIGTNNYVVTGGTGAYGTQNMYQVGDGGVGQLNGTTIAGTSGSNGAMGLTGISIAGARGVGAGSGNGGVGGYVSYESAYSAGGSGGDGYIEFAYNPIPQYWYVRAFGSATNQGTIDITELANALNAKLSISSVPLVTGYNGKQTFTSSGSFTAPITGIYRITLQGAGGGGSGAGTDNALVHSSGSGGGQGGHGVFYEKLTAGTTYSFAVGAGGVGGTAGSSNYGTGGGGATGGSSTITINSNTYLAGGGYGAADYNAAWLGGVGGVFKMNDTEIVGMRGASGGVGKINDRSATGGTGGGQGGGINGNDGAPGAGGGGGILNYDSVYLAGGAGGNGYITFEWLDTSLL